MKHQFIINKEIWAAWGGSFVPTEQPLIEWARQFQHPEKIALDIGAHVGDWAVDMAAHSRRVYAFEPQRDIYQLLSANIYEYPNIFPLDFALGNVEGRAPLFVNPDGSGGTSMLQTPMHPGDIKHETLVRTLDSFRFEGISLIKIDVEGNEIAVLRGAHETIMREAPKIIFEAWSYPWFAEKRAELLDYVQALGYKVTPLTWPDSFLAEPKAR